MTDATDIDWVGDFPMEEVAGTPSDVRARLLAALEPVSGRVLTIRIAGGDDDLVFPVMMVRPRDQRELVGRLRDDEFASIAILRVPYDETGLCTIERHGRVR